MSTGVGGADDDDRSDHESRNDCSGSGPSIYEKGHKESVLMGSLRLFPGCTGSAMDRR